MRSNRSQTRHKVEKYCCKFSSSELGATLKLKIEKFADLANIDNAQAQSQASQNGQCRVREPLPARIAGDGIPCRLKFAHDFLCVWCKQCDKRYPENHVPAVIGMINDFCNRWCGISGYTSHCLKNSDGVAERSGTKNSHGANHS